jgi:MoaA/NifB/PqqE/SkfB family radical SAM enzyme
MSLSPSRLFQGALHLHSGIPYRLLDGRHAFKPWHYYLEITRRCNLRCRMCNNIKWLQETNAKEQAENELSTEEWKGVIDQIGRPALITLTGGEPWLRPDFPELLEYACSRHVVHCITNASLLKEREVKRCVELAPRRLQTKGLFFMGISLDALGELHDEIRGARGIFEKAERAIRLLASLREKAGKRYPMLHVTSVIQEANVDILPKMPAYIREMGADIYNLTLELRSWDIAGLGSFDPALISLESIGQPRIDPERLRSALEATRREAEKAGIELRLPRMPLEEVVRYYSEGHALERFRCLVPWNTMWISYDGEASPCYIKVVGNVRRSSLKEIWASPQMREFRTSARRGLWPVCHGCCGMEYKK